MRKRVGTGPTGDMRRLGGLDPSRRHTQCGECYSWTGWRMEDGTDTHPSTRIKKIRLIS